MIAAVLVFSVSAEPLCAAEPRRILSIAPSATEILYDLGLGERVVGVTKYCTWPPEAADKPRISDMMDLNMEVVAALEPDLAVISNMNGHLEARLRAFGVDVLVVYQDDFSGICASILETGRVCGVEERAENRVGELENSVRELSERARALAAKKGFGNGESPRVLVVVGRDMADPDFRKVYVAGAESFYDDLLAESGARNAVDLYVPYMNLSREGLLRIDPDMIIEILGEHGNVLYEISGAAEQWGAFDALRAVRGGNISILKGDFALRAGPRYPLVLSAFIRAIYGGERAISE